MRSIEDTLASMLPWFPPLPAAQVALHAALGRVLVAPLYADFPLPAFDNSAMDGYAVRFQDARDEGASLLVQGEIQAGATAPASLAEGTAARIFTGAPLPPGADTVIAQEDTSPGPNGTVRLLRPASRKGQHVRILGSDVAAASELLPGGTVLTAGALALLAAQGHASVAVHQRPTVAIVSTGDELVDVAGAGKPWSVVNTNAYALSAQVREAGGEPWVLPAAPDDLNAIQDRLAAALRADVVLCSGGVSVGEYDLVARAFEALSIRTELWKVAIKPGKPLRFGVRQRLPVVGLPGNPASAMVTFEVFVRPGIRRMCGFRRLHRPRITVTLDHDYTRKPGRTELARGELLGGLPAPRMRLYRDQGSGGLRSMARAEALAVIPKDVARIKEGDTVHALLLNPQALSETDGNPYVT